MGGIEINQRARDIAPNKGSENIQLGSIVEPIQTEGYDVCFTSGVLIHINPDKLHQVHKTLFLNSRKYVVIIENYNLAPVEVP